MRKTAVFCVLIVMLLFICGCKAASFKLCRLWPRNKAADEGSYICQLHPSLNVQEKYFLTTWQKAAVLADDVGDCETAVLYYNKIVEYFPDTKEALYAHKRLAILIKTSEKNIKNSGDPALKR
ncbi:MAG: hypothetical protein KKA52_05420 [Candidatus Omnitrophica bacterium]|nr:hypothetical protein [Candidatus Omnitrophota bacterium]